jgi:predicted Zn finger-like uncharacterized protein
MSNMVTRCPQCHTSFKVTEEHLKIANGAVRCGSCLLVFQARQHWVNPENMSATPPAAATSAAGAGKFSFDQSAIDSSAAGGAPAKPFSLNAESSPPKAEAEHAHKKLEEIGDDDRISDDLDIEDDEPEIVPPKAAAKKNQFGEPDDDYASVFDEFEDQAGATSFDEILEEDFNDLDALAANGGSNGDAADKADDAWAKDMLAEIEKKEKPEPVDLDKVSDLREILTDFTNPVDVDAARRDLGFDRVDPFAARELGAKKADAAREGRAEMIAHIEPPPVELLPGTANHAVDWKSILLWNASAAALALLLVIQYVGFNFDRLAKTGAARPYMQAICGLARCKLPSVENWRYIKIQNLVVRQHPQVPDGLAVDAILFNVTGQDLPFPQLELFFSDLAKTPVASRRFEPAEYLSGELSGQTKMPPGRPVHIAFEIVNPGEKAVNWNLQVAGKTD